MPGGRPSVPLKLRFNQNKYEIDPNTNCWVWKKAVNNIGYGFIRDGNRMRTAHRVSYELYKGEIPKGLCVCHSCDNPKCVNPDHLWLGTTQQNIDDMISKGRQVTRPIGYKHPLSTCIHCGQTRPNNIIGKLHNDKCKYKP